MSETELALIISLEAENVPARKLFQWTDQVRRQLIGAGADSVRRAQGYKLPEGAKGSPFDPNTLITTLGSAGVLTAIIQLLQQWVLRREGRKVKIKAEIAGGNFEFEYTPTITSPNELIAFVDMLNERMKPV